MKKPHWPDRWDEKKGVIYYRPRGNERELWDGKYYFRLGLTEQEAYTTWYSRIGSIAVPRKIRDAIGIYRASPNWARLSDRSKKDYTRALDLLLKSFGHFSPAELLPTHVYMYMDKRPPISANREKAVLSNVMQECVRRGACTHNVVRDVEGNRETPRDRYVTDEELADFLEFCTPFLKSWVQLKLLTGLRQSQLRNLRRQDWDGERLTVAAAKGGRKIIFTGEGLSDAISAALAVRANSKHQSMFIFSTRKGTQYTADGFRNLWQYAMNNYLNDGGTRFTEHDLRAKVASDSESVVEANKRMGHQSINTTNRVYRRAPQKVSVLERLRNNKDSS